MGSELSKKKLRADVNHTQKRKRFALGRRLQENISRKESYDILDDELMQVPAAIRRSRLSQCRRIVSSVG